ncbi:hypothetical protein PS3A_61490 [Pseudomonas sp. 3A(2025)]
MNAGITPHASRGLSVSSEARTVIAAWLRSTRFPKPRPDTRAMLIQRYPRGLFSEAELQALVTMIES